MYPKGDIPVIQLSVNPYLPPREQFRIGEALRGLDEQDILVLGSGVTVHSLRMLNWAAQGSDIPDKWADEFERSISCRCSSLWAVGTRNGSRRSFIAAMIWAPSAIFASDFDRNT